MTRPNIILIISDTVRYDYCGFNGNDWAQTPNLDALARESAVMDNHYVASFPTGPMRKDTHSGRFTFAYTNWGGERPTDEAVLGEILRDASYTTAYIGDTNNSRQYLSGFEHLEMVSRNGARLDLVPETVELTAHPDKLRFPMAYAQKIRRNSLAWDGEADRPVARSARAAHRWLEDHAHDDKPFFLWFDTFDPHEPWDEPRHYIDLYDKGYKGDELMEPAYQSAGYASKREIRHMRCMYAGKLTMVDRWIGFLLDGVRLMGLMDNTVIVFTSDHGFYHGEHNLIGKVRLAREGVVVGRWPLYSSISHTPLIIHLPGRMRAKRWKAFCQPPDITATILDVARVRPPKRVQGQSLLPVIQGKRRANRDIAVSTMTHITDEQVRCPAAIRNRKYLYVYGGDEWQSELFDLQNDPDETRNVIRKNRKEAEKLHGKYIEFLRMIGCPQSSIEARSEFNPKPRKDVPEKKLM